MDSPDLAALERRTYRESFDHGLIDILLGGYLVVLGLQLSFKLGPMGLVGGLMGGAAFPIGYALRKALVEPRIGYVKFSPARRSRVRWGPCIAAALMVAIILIGIWAIGRRAEFYLFPGFFPAIVFALPIAVCGYFLEIQRMYLYGAMLVLERWLDAASGEPFEWMYWPSGLIIAAIGFVVLARFLRRYPLLHGVNKGA
jgi:hypothetical protein